MKFEYLQENDKTSMSVTVYVPDKIVKVEINSIGYKDYNNCQQGYVRLFFL